MTNETLARAMVSLAGAIQKLTTELQTRKTAREIAAKPRAGESTTLPADFPDEAMRTAAKATYPAIDIDHEAQKFRLRYELSGETRESWHQTWTRWLAGAKPAPPVPAEQPPSWRKELNSIDPSRRALTPEEADDAKLILGHIPATAKESSIRQWGMMARVRRAEREKSERRWRRQEIREPTE